MENKNTVKSEDNEIQATKPKKGGVPPTPNSPPPPPPSTPETPIIKEKKPRTEAQILAFKKAQEKIKENKAIRDENRRLQKLIEEKETKKIAAKAISIKK